MGLMDSSMMQHVGIVLLMLWLLSAFNCCYPVVYFISLIYLFLIHERYAMRLKKRIQFEEKKQANQRRVLSDSETVRWLNHMLEKIWPICMEQIVSQKILLPIVPWFLAKYEPWIAKKVKVRHLYLGRTPPIFTEMRALHRPSEDDDLVLELGMNLVTADDMSGILDVKLRKRVGFGIQTKLHLTGMHVEGKVLVGIKFLKAWPFLGRLRLCFAEPPYFQMTVKPIFTRGLNVTELPGIAGWLDKLLSTVFEQTLVQPNMMVVDMEKFVSPQQEPWFSVDVKEPVGYVKVEVIEGAEMKPSDLNGLADPYLVGQLGPYNFKTKTHRKTLAPAWQEEFKIPVVSWESQNVLAIKVHDKDNLKHDDLLGVCSVNITDLRDGQRHDMWLPLQNVKQGRLHLAITVLDVNSKLNDQPCDKEEIKVEVSPRNSTGRESARKVSFSTPSSERSPRTADDFEPVNIEEQNKTGIWIHHPGSEVPKIWETREGRSRQSDIKIEGETNVSINKDSSSSDENPGEKHSRNPVRRGLRKIGSVFHRSFKKDDQSANLVEPLRSPYVNLREMNEKEGGIKFVVEENLSGGLASGGNAKDGKSTSPENTASPESPSKGGNIFEKSARGIKYAFAHKDSRRDKGDCLEINEREIAVESDSSSSDGEPILAYSPDVVPVICEGNDLLNVKGHVVESAIGDANTKELESTESSEKDP